MVKYLIPTTLDFFKKDCPDRDHWDEISKVIRNVLEALTSGAIFLVKKRFGQKIVYTCNADYGRHPHRLLFEKLESPARYVLRSVVWNHDYRKALTLEPLTIEEMQEMQETVVSVEYNEGEATPLISYNNSGYELTPIQSEILKCPTFPQLIVGPPGSGKTLTAMAFFQEQALKWVQEDGETPLRLLYLTGSNDLKNSVARSWQHWIKETFNNTQPRQVEVVFSTFEEQLVNILPREDAIERIRKLLKISSPENSTLTAEAVFDEFLINSHLLVADVGGSIQATFSQSSYARRGANKSSLEDKYLNEVYDLFAIFYHQAQNKGEFILGISKHPANDETTHFDFTVVDEAQNNTLTDLLNALHQTKNKQILFLGDSLQKGAIRVSSLPLLEPDLHAQKIVLKTHHLPGTHRLKPGVAAVANDVVRLYTCLKDGLADSTSYSSLSSHAAAAPDDDSLSWVSEWSDKYHSLGKNAHAAALIFHERDRKTAQKLINSNNVFTTEEAQGLEFSELFLYVSAETMESFLPISKEMKARHINKDTLLVEKKSLSSQKGIVDGAHLEFLSLFYVALTRTYGDAWVYIAPLDNSDNHRHAPFINWLKSRFNQKEAKALTEQVSSSEEWLTMAHRLIDQSQLIQAKENLIRHCGFNTQTAEEHINQRLQSLSGLNSVISASEPLQNETRLTPGKKVNKKTAPITLKPDKAKWIEEHLKIFSNKPEEIKLLSKWDKAQVTTMLFHHKMLNGNCLFINLICNNKYPKKTLLSIFDKLNKCSSGTFGTDVLRILTEAPQGILWLYNEHAVLKPYIKGPEWFIASGDGTPFFRLCSSDKGLAFLASHWNDIKGHLTAERLFAPLTNEGANQGTTPFYHLCSSDEGIAFLKSHWSDIKRHVTAEGLFTPATGDGPNQDATPFSWLCFHKENLALLKSCWNDIKGHLTAERLFAPVTGNGPNQGMTPFYCLCGNDEGITFLKSHWNDIKRHVTTEGLFTPVTGDGPDKGATPFFWLCVCEESLALLTSHWNDIKGHLTAERFFAPVTGEGPNQGITPFYCLCGNDEGIAFLKSHWSDIKRHVTSERLFTPLIGDGFNQGMTPFYCLCVREEGIALLASHWNDIKGNLTAEKLFAPVTGDGPNQGATPFFCLCAREENLILLKSCWNDIKGHLTAERLFTPLTGDGSNQGMTPFYCLCGNDEGIAFIASHWNDIKEHLTAEGLFAPRTGDGPMQGSTPFSSLCVHAEGIAFLASHWNDLKRYLTAERLFAPLTGDGAMKGTTIFSSLCTCKEGFALLASHWNDLKGHLTAEGLFVPVTGDGPQKGLTPFYCLCASDEGLAILASHWSDIKGLLTAEGLFTPLTGDGPEKGTTPFYCLCASEAGIALLKSHWKSTFSRLVKESDIADVPNSKQLRELFKPSSSSIIGFFPPHTPEGDEPSSAASSLTAPEV